MTIVGFTGTREEPSELQLKWLRDKLIELEARQLHHGDCVGADTAANAIAGELSIYRVVHPPINGSMRAFCEAEEYRAPKDYDVRNHNIVLESEVLLALPPCPEILRSGTWSTVRFARRIGRCPDTEIMWCLP